MEDGPVVTILARYISGPVVFLGKTIQHIRTLSARIHNGRSAVLVVIASSDDDIFTLQERLERIEEPLVDAPTVPISRECERALMIDIPAQIQIYAAPILYDGQSDVLPDLFE